MSAACSDEAVLAPERARELPGHKGALPVAGVTRKGERLGHIGRLDPGAEPGIAALDLLAAEGREPILLGALAAERVQPLGCRDPSPWSG